MAVWLSDPAKRSEGKAEVGAYVARPLSQRDDKAKNMERTRGR